MGMEKINGGLSPRKVALLLKIGASDPKDTDQTSPEEARAELLRDRLANRLPADSLAVQQLLAHLGELYNTFSSASGESIERRLLDRGTEIDTLRRIKEYGAALSRSAQSTVEQETANVIYYGAIASVLIFHGRRITDFKLEDLQGAFTTLSGMPWLPPALAGHFKQAVQFCRQSRGQAERSRDE